MPLSGHEEGVDSHAWYSSDSVVGVPIKKRRFLLVRPPSPPPPETPSLQQHEKEEESSTNPETSSSNAGAIDGKCEQMEIIGHGFAVRDACLVQNKVNDRPELHVRSLPLSSSVVGSGLATGRNQESEGVNCPGNTEPRLALGGNVVAQVGETRVIKKEIIASEETKLSGDPESTKMLMVPKETPHLVSAGENRERGCKEHEKLDPHSWNLGLSKGQACRNDNGVDLKTDCIQLTNRSHWDLNTIMESWEESSTDLIIAQGTGGMDLLGGSIQHDIKPVKCSTPMSVSEPKVPFVLGKNILDKSEQGAMLPTFHASVTTLSKSDDLLNLRLQPTFIPQAGLGRELSCLHAERDPRELQSNRSFSNVLVTPSKNVDHRIVKSEPFDESSRLDLAAKVGTPELVERKIIKSEPLQGSVEEPHKLSDKNMEFLDRRAVKSEPVQGDSLGNLEKLGKMSSHTKIPTGNSEVPFSGEASSCSDVPTFDFGIPRTRDLSDTTELTTKSGLPNRGKVSNHSVLSTCVNEVPISNDVGVEAKGAAGCVASCSVSGPASSDGKESKSTIDTDVPERECLDTVDPGQSMLNSNSEAHVDSLGNGVIAESDEEKVNISAEEELCYDSDYESDGNHAIGSSLDAEDKQRNSVDDDYEDGEVREPSVDSESEDGVHVEGEVEHVDGSMHASTLDDIITTSSEVDDRDARIDDTRNVDCSEQSDIILCSREEDQLRNEVLGLQECLPAEVLPTVGIEEEKPNTVVGRQELEPSGREDKTKGSDEVSGDDKVSASGAILGLNEASATKDGKDDVETQHDDANRTNSLGTSSSALSKAEPCGSSDETAKDVNGQGSRSRIITLPRQSNVASSGGIKPVPSRILPSRSEREKFARGSRDDRYFDPNFERKRSRDHSFGRTGTDFRFGRGRGDNRRSRHYDWDSNNDFSAEQCNGPTGYRFPRSKNASSSKLDSSGYFVARGGNAMGAGRGRGGRKPMNDDLPNFCHPPSRRRSPGGREGLMPRDVQMVRRPHRDISPDRCINGDGADMVGLRPDEKFMRGLPDMRNPVFSRSQSQYDRVGDAFVRGDRSFSPMQRRVPLNAPRVRSKSPPRSRTRSPGPWSSPRRRSPDGFVGHQEMAHCRSPRMYRTKRMRSPHQHPCFAEEMVVRRHGSPPFMSRICNDMREISSSREHDCPMPFIPSRSPSGRVVPRNTRRYDMVDPRERTESEEFFVGETPPARFHELVGDEGVYGRRKCVERGGPVQSFRPPYNSSDIEKFRHDEEDVPRAYRFCPEVDSEFRDRGTLRDGRGFDRRMRRRPENIEEQEENYWDNGQVWHDADFADDVTHMKSRRF